MLQRTVVEHQLLQRKNLACKSYLGLPSLLQPTNRSAWAANWASPQAPARAVCFPNRTVSLRLKASNASAQTAQESKWWLQGSDLWQQVHSVEEFEREVLQSQKPVLVDWYAPWCQGCSKSYPEVCTILRNSNVFKKGFKLVKVCIDDLPKSFSKSEGVTALPRLGVYRPGEGRAIVLDIPISRVKHLRANLHTVLANPNSTLALDPNGFVVATGNPVKPKPQGQEQALQVAQNHAADIAALEGGSSRYSNGSSRSNGSGSSINTAAAASKASQPNPATGVEAAVSASSSSSSSSAASSSQAASGLPGSPQPMTGEQYIATFVRQYGQAYSQSREAFITRYASEYGYGGRINDLYPREVGVRMAPLPGHETVLQHYMDYTGSSVYLQSQLAEIFQELSTCMFGNPHSQNPSSALTSERIDEARAKVMKFFNADPSDWQLVFTRSATGALQLVGETFPWTSGSLFRYLRENHSSVLGVREYALQHGAAFQAVDEQLVGQWVRAPPPSPSAAAGPEAAPSSHDHVPPSAPQQPQQEPVYSLFAYAAEDNFAGVKYPLGWAADIKRRSTDAHKWLVLVDAAAYAPTQPLDLSTLQADFVDVAFYKIFGYPTGLGALFVRTEVEPLLKKVFWGGGSVSLATSNENFHVFKCKPTDKLEDGTVSFLDIMSLRQGFAAIEQLGGIKRIQSHVAVLTEWLYDSLSKLTHSNGAPLVKIFGKHDRPNRRMVQGGILNFEVLSPSGQVLSYRTFEREAAAAGFHVRTGVECNPGAAYNNLGVLESEVESLVGQKEGCGDDVEFIKVQRPAEAGSGTAAAASSGGQAYHSSDVLRSLASAPRLALGHPGEVALKWMTVPLGSVRVSLGWMSTFEDCYALVDWVGRTYRDREEELPSDGSVVTVGPGGVVQYTSS